MHRAINVEQASKGYSDGPKLIDSFKNSSRHIYIYLEKPITFNVIKKLKTIKYLVYTEYRNYAPPSNKRRIWDREVNKRYTQIGAEVPMRRLFEEFRLTKVPLQRKSETVLEMSFL